MSSDPKSRLVDPDAPDRAETSRAPDGEPPIPDVPGPSIEALATLGRQAAVAAHELNNVLTSVLGWAQVALRDLGNGSTVESALRTIEANSRRARRILRDALDPARTEGVRRSTLPVDVVDDALRLLAWELRRAGVRVVRTYLPVPEVAMDRGAIQQVLVNLLLNAVEAMPEGGEVQVRVRPERAGVAIDVSDQGAGMSSEVAERAFDPFFSTKRAGEQPTGGSGLGLAIARRITEQHGGTLELQSAAGAGATFTMWLPIGRPTVEAKPDQPTLARGSGKILVVDDESDIRELLATALGLQGYTVVTAADAASGRVRALADDVMMVLLDYHLPAATGSEVLAELRTKRPDLPVLFMSGRTGAESGEMPAVTVGPTGWLRKPFDLDEVYREVARLLPSG